MSSPKKHNTKKKTTRRQNEQEAEKRGECKSLSNIYIPVSNELLGNHVHVHSASSPVTCAKPTKARFDKIIQRKVHAMQITRKLPSCPSAFSQFTHENNSDFADFETFLCFSLKAGRLLLVNEAFFRERKVFQKMLMSCLISDDRL